MYDPAKARMGVDGAATGCGNGEVDLRWAGPQQQDVPGCSAASCLDQTRSPERCGRNSEAATSRLVIGGQVHRDAERMKALDNQPNAIEAGLAVTSLQAEGRTHQPLRRCRERV